MDNPFGETVFEINTKEKQIGYSKNGKQEVGKMLSMHIQYAVIIFTWIDLGVVACQFHQVFPSVQRLMNLQYTKI